MRQMKPVTVKSKGKSYTYAWKGGPRIKAEPGTPEFDVELQAAHSRRHIPKAQTINDMLKAYAITPDFRSLKPATRSIYELRMERIKTAWGSNPLTLLEKRGARGGLLQWRDEIALKSPAAADQTLTVFNLILAWAVDREMLLLNPLAKFKALKKDSRRNVVWSDELIERFLTHASDPIAWGFNLALLTGQRRGDLLDMQWSQIKDGLIRIKQEKTGKKVVVPVEGDLTHLLASIPKRSSHILTNQHGRPWTRSGFSSSVYMTCKRAEIEGLHFHDLRGTYVLRRYAAGESMEDIAAITGHDDVEGVLRNAYLPQSAHVIRMEKRFAKPEKNSA